MTCLLRSQSTRGCQRRVTNGGRTSPNASVEFEVVLDSNNVVLSTHGSGRARGEREETTLARSPWR